MGLPVTPITMVSFLVVIFQQIQVHETMPSRGGFNQLHSASSMFFIGEEKKASHVRPIHLYSKQGHYVSILANGTVTATADRNSPDAILEMHSYSVNKKRIRRPRNPKDASDQVDWWLCIDKKGRIRTRKQQRKDTIFYEHDDGLWLWYENKHGILAFRKNFQPKHGVTMKDLKKNKRNKFSKFLIMKLSPNLQPYSRKKSAR